MASTILSQILNLINTGQPLAAAVESIVPGADPAYWQQVVSRHESKPANTPKKANKKQTRSNSRRRTMRTVIPFAPSFAEKQNERTGKATAELVARVNGKEEPRFVNSILEVF